VTDVAADSPSGNAPGETEVRLQVERRLPFLEADGEGEPAGGDLLFGVIDMVGDPEDVSLQGRQALVFHREAVLPGEHLVVRRDRALQMPDGYPHDAARSAVRGGIAAVLMAEDQARLAASDTVLVVGACSPIGNAVCQVARAIGARVLAGSEAPEKLEALREQNFEAVDLSDAGWRASVLSGVGRFGVDVVIGATGGALFDEAFAWVLGNFGRYVLYGQAGDSPVEIDADELRSGCKTVSGFRLDQLAERNLERVVRGFRRYAMLVRTEQVQLPG
jgi:NADPH:quinone reductase-like Zn-dependent oxidoreductase